MFFVLADATKQQKVELIYEKYKKDMYYIAYSVLHDAYQAEDAVQQAFLKVLHILDTFEVDSPKTRNFLIIVSKNTAIDFYNKNKKRSYYEEIDIPVTTDPQQVVIDDENYEELVRQMKNLKPIYRDVAFLKLSHGYSNELIAEYLSITPDTVRKRLERARHLLKLTLKKVEREAIR